MEDWNPCRSCNEHEGKPEHPCPYQEDINDDATTLCNCCNQCCQECADDI